MIILIPERRTKEMREALEEAAYCHESTEEVEPSYF